MNNLDKLQALADEDITIDNSDTYLINNGEIAFLACRDELLAVVRAAYLDHRPSTGVTKALEALDAKLKEVLG